MTTNREKTLEAAEKKAIDAISSINLEERFRHLSINFKQEVDSLNFYAFGKNLSISLSDYSIIHNDSGALLHQVERILILHYVSYESKVKETGDLISFRDLPGGNFYYGPFQGRTIRPLIAKIGNDIHRLKKGLNSFKWSHRDEGDFSGKIHIIGNIFIHLIYWLGDNEFQPNADILFDSSIKKVFATEDVVTIASRICFSIIQ